MKAKRLWTWAQIIVAATLLGLVVSHLVESSDKDEDMAKYIFLFIGDGMGHGQISLAESYLSYKEGKLGGERLSFTEFPVYGTCETYSMDYSVTCSSAAGSAIACGR